MKKLKSTLPNMILSLGIITIVAGAVLGAVYMVTKKPIEEAALAQQTAAIAAVAPAFDNVPDNDARVFDVNGVSATVYPAFFNGKLNGAAVKTTVMSGFSGEVTVMCGFNADGSVKDYTVLQHAETPGLGSKMQTWFRDPVGKRSILGRNPDTTSFYVTKDTDKGGEIDAITAATISSRAFLEAVRAASEAFKTYKNSEQ